MSANANSFEHIYNAIARDFSEEFPELTIVYILYEPGKALETLTARRGSVDHHPAGRAALQDAQNLLKSSGHPHGSFCAGFATYFNAKFMGIIRKREDFAICMVETSANTLFEDRKFACRHAAYAAGFEALHKHMEASRTKHDERHEKEKTDPAKALSNRMRIRLMADCFATMMIETTGTKGAIQVVVKKHCALCLDKVLHFWPEDHPMPMAYDGINVVYKDLKDEAAPKTGPMAHIHFMAEEVGNTYDDISLTQWIRFANSAQEMAWAGYSANEILSAAIYSAENPYIRSNAHICAESLNTNPVPLKNTDIFNPFAGDEVLERNHLRICRTGFVEILEDVNEQNNPGLFFKRAKTQTEKFMAGNPLGWCAPALIETENAYRLFMETPNTEEETIGNAFQSVCSLLKWTDLHRLNRKAVYARRIGRDTTPESMLGLMGNEETYKAYKTAFQILFTDEKSPAQ